MHWVWVYWCFTSHATIFQSYMWRHRCAGRQKEKLYLRSGSQRHRHFVGFFNVPALHRHGTTLFIRWFRHTAPFSRLLRHTGDTEDVQYSRLKSPASWRGYACTVSYWSHRGVCWQSAVHPFLVLNYIFFREQSKYVKLIQCNRIEIFIIFIEIAFIGIAIK